MGEQSTSAMQLLCDRLSDRTATLFLGAGVNAGVVNLQGDSFPLGQALSDWISRDLLEDDSKAIPLSESSEIARYKLGKEPLNKYLYDKFSTFKPSTAHLSAVQLPWDAIYTTNYDSLIETAAVAPSVTAAGVIQQIFSAQKDIADLEEIDIPYYKLHGSIEYANSAEGRLILTKEDYRYYLTHRKPLFKRLQRDLLSRSFLFVGYSLTDENFRAILDDCLEELNTSTLPLSFAVWHDFSGFQETYWREKYNIQLLRADAGTFLNELKTTWLAQNRYVTPLEERKSKEYLKFDDNTHFPKVAESFYRLDPAFCTGMSNPSLFFKGAEPSWNDIHSAFIPERDAYWTLLDAMFQELVDAKRPPNMYLVTGSAGTGKTTMLYTLALNIVKDFQLQVLVHIAGTPLEARAIAPLVETENAKRIIVVVRHAAEKVRELERFLADARQLNLPITVLLEERKNQWAVASNSLKSRLRIAEYELGSLSEEEIERIINALEQCGCLGKLTGTPRNYQIEHFRKLAHKELLVALRELTSEGAFDDIIRDEYQKIPSAIAKEAYKYVATFGQLDMQIRYEVLVHVLGLDYDQLKAEVFQPTEGILVSGEHMGRSRHDMGFRLSTRHPVIASVIFDLVAPDDDHKLEVFNRLLAFLDPGHREDKRLLEAIVRRKELVSTLASAENRRAIYDRLEQLLPSNGFVLQHRSILERDLENPQAAVMYARKALKANDSRNLGIVNTLGLALEFEARNTTDPLKYQALLAESNRYFDEGIRADSSDPYGYLGKYYLLKQQLERATSFEQKSLLKASIVSLLDEAFELTYESDVLAGLYSEQQMRAGQSDDALNVLQNALTKDPTNFRIRERLVDFERSRNPQLALKIALDGAKLDATAWRLQRQIARILQITGGDIITVKGHYEAAIRHNKGNLNLLIEFGAYLYKNDKQDESRAIFSAASLVPVGISKKRAVQSYWKDKSNKDIRFNGKIKSIDGAMAFAIAIPQNFEASFWRSERLTTLREGNAITFSVAFNAYGPQARDIEVLRK